MFDGRLQYRPLRAFASGWSLPRHCLTLCRQGLRGNPDTRCGGARRQHLAIVAVPGRTPCTAPESLPRAALPPMCRPSFVIPGDVFDLHFSGFMVNESPPHLPQVAAWPAVNAPVPIPQPVRGILRPAMCGPRSRWPGSSAGARAPSRAGAADGRVPVSCRREPAGVQAG